MNQQTVALKSDTLSTSKFEQRMEQIKNDIQRYRSIEQSPELKEFQSLREVVETKEFQDNKNYLLHRKYRDTDEYKKMARYRRLKITPVVQRYRWIRNYPNFKEYLAFAQSERYTELKDKAAVAASKELRLYKWIDRSLTLKNYRYCEKSANTKEFLNLRELIHTEEFIQNNAFWANPQRWYTTPESTQDERYQQLKNSDDIRFFLSQSAEQIAEWESYKTLFADECNQQSAWKSGFFYNNKNLKTDHSYCNELQANNHGKNVSVGDSVISVSTRNEQVTAPAWHPTKGFITKDFDWTADVIQTADTFQSSTGVFLAKVRVSGIANAAVYLATGERQPILKLMQWDGRQISAGIRTENDEAGVVIDGLKAGQWYIYAVSITDKEIVWAVNGQEILRIKNNLGKQSFYPAIAEFLPANLPAGKGQVDVDWVRVFSRQ